MRTKFVCLFVLLFVLSGAVIIAQDQDFEVEYQPMTFEHFVIDMPLSETGLDPQCLGKDEAFIPYAHMLSVECDDEFMYVESFSFAEHTMMVGITLWNGQVPVPQPIINENSWRIPLHPELSGTTEPTVGQGPIAVAINGVMIYNPTRQDGIYSEDSDPYLIGELDICGGHSGRGDDYHYHISPVCLMGELAEHSDGTLPIAYALDGFPIYGFTNPDGSTPELDECNGQFDEDGNYHYHATEDYPYINGCFKGAFDISLQPAPHPIREAVEGLASPHILVTALYQADDGWIHFEYDSEGLSKAIIYHEEDELCFRYLFYDDVTTDVVTRDETHCRNANDANGSQPPANDGSQPPANDGNPPPNDGSNPPPNGTPPPTPGS